MTDLEILYNAYRDSGMQTNEENGKVRTMKARLKAKGFIDYDHGKPVTILKPYRENVEKPESFKAAIYREMLEVYMDDFRNQDTFKDRLQVGQEIRMILKAI